MFGRSQTDVFCDLCWRTVHGMPPHQLWETFVCSVLVVNCLFALLYTTDQSDRIDSMQV